MFGILITALKAAGEEANQIISQLKLKGYNEQDISIIAKVNKGQVEQKQDAEIFPHLGNLLITGPVAPAVNFIKQDSCGESDAQDALFTLLTDIGIPPEDAFYFTEIVEQDGFIIVLPEFGDLSVYEILWNFGADRILVLEEDPSTSFDTL